MNRKELGYDRHTVSLLSNHMWAPSCYHGSVGSGWDVVSNAHHAKTAAGLVHCTGFGVTASTLVLMLQKGGKNL